MVYILILALALRLVFIGQSLWLDEAIQALALMGRQGPLLSYALSDFQPPLYHFLLKGWTTVFGYSEFALRTPSLLAGVAVVYFVYKLGELIHSRRAGAIGALIASTNPLLIYYSQEGRTYMLTTLFVTMSFYFLLKRSSLAYLFATLLAIWSSYLACLIVPLQLIYLVSQKRYRLAVALTIVSSSLLLWIPSFLRSLSIGMGDASVYPAWGQVVGGISLKALALTWVKSAIGRISFSPPWLYGTIVLCIFALHAFIVRHVKKLHPLILIWLSTLVLSALISFFVPAYSYTRVLFVVPSYLLILSLGLAHIKNRWWLYTIIVTQLACTGVYYFSPQFHREDWRKLTADIHSLTGSPTIAMPSHEQNPGLLYYGIRESDVIEPQIDPIAGDTIYYVRYAEDLFDTARHGQANLSKAGYTIMSQKVYPGIQLDVYEK